MPDERLRLAAGLLRQRLETTTPGIWRDNGTYGSVVSDAQPHNDGYNGRLVGESMRPGDREYLVSMQPAVGRALAGLLEAVAVLYDDTDAGAFPAAPHDHAVLIAAALLDASRDAMPGDPLAHLEETDRA